MILMIDYKKIADNDVGGEIDVALPVMKLLTEQNTPDEKMVTYRNIGSNVGLAESLEFETKIKAAETLPEWVNISLSNDGINVNDSQVAGVLSGLGLADGVADSIIALGVEDNLMFPNLRAGHLEVARAKRLAGEI